MILRIFLRQGNVPYLDHLVSDMPFDFVEFSQQVSNSLGLTINEFWVPVDNIAFLCMVREDETKPKSSKGHLH